jgi:hypothetical protein
MSINYFFYYSLSSTVIPLLQSESDVFEKHGFRFAPSGYKYILDDGELVETEAHLVASTWKDIFLLDANMQLMLIQTWRAAGGAGFSFGHFEHDSNLIGIMMISGNQVDEILKILKLKKIKFIDFLSDIYLSIGAKFLLGLSEGEMDTADLFEVLKKRDFSLDFFRFNINSIFGNSKYSIDKELLGQYTASSNGYQLFLTRWPFDQ